MVRVSKGFRVAEITHGHFAKCPCVVRDVPESVFLEGVDDSGGFCVEVAGEFAWPLLLVESERRGEGASADGTYGCYRRAVDWFSTNQR